MKIKGNMTVAEMGRRGGQARAKKLSKERRREIAKLAANKRWNKRDADIAAAGEQFDKFKNSGHIVRRNVSAQTKR